MATIERRLARRFFRSHPKKGKDTMFVEKFLSGLGVNYKGSEYFFKLFGLNNDAIKSHHLNLADLYAFTGSLKLMDGKYFEVNKKFHTIRQGNEFQDGDKILLRVNEAAPGKSPKKITIWDPMEVKTYNFEHSMGLPFINDLFIDNEEYTRLAANDGMTPGDLQAWFEEAEQKTVFKGQIICWNDQITY